MDTLYIVLPAYNEEENIENVIRQWYPVVEKCGANSRLVIVNDGSKDNTFEIMQSIAPRFPQFIPLTKSNSGHGATLLFAYNYAIDSGADWVFQTDSDGQTEPNEFWDFWELRDHFNFVIGTRKGRQDGANRIFVTKVLKIVLWVIFGQVVDDSNTPFRLLNAKALQKLLPLIPKDFFLSNVILSLLVVEKKERVKWIPITFKPRQGGVNSINFKRIVVIGVKAVKDFFQIRRSIKADEV